MTSVIISVWLFPKTSLCKSSCNAAIGESEYIQFDFSQMCALYIQLSAESFIVSNIGLVIDTEIDNGIGQYYT